MDAVILARFRMMPGLLSSRATSSSVKAAALPGSNPAKAHPKFSRLRRTVIQDNPDWNASRVIRS
jgi:hypothetical protein